MTKCAKKPSHATVPLTTVFVAPASQRYSWLFGFCISMVPFLLLIEHCSEYWIINRGQCFLAGRMIWLFGHPLSPSLVSKLGRRHTGRLRKRDNLADGRGGGWRGRAWSRIIRPQESLVLYKSFNTLWPAVYSKICKCNFLVSGCMNWKRILIHQKK